MKSQNRGQHHTQGRRPANPSRRCGTRSGGDTAFGEDTAGLFLTWGRDMPQPKATSSAWKLFRRVFQEQGEHSPPPPPRAPKLRCRNPWRRRGGGRLPLLGLLIPIFALFGVTRLKIKRPPPPLLPFQPTPHPLLLYHADSDFKVSKKNTNHIVTHPNILLRRWYIQRRNRCQSESIAHFDILKRDFNMLQDPRGAGDEGDGESGPGTHPPTGGGGRLNYRQLPPFNYIS